MFRNYLKIALRILIRQKIYSIINMAGLAVGMAACIMILLWIQDEIGFERVHKNIDDLYRVVVINRSTDQVEQHWNSPGPLGPALKEQFPEVELAARVDRFDEVLVQFEDKSFMESRFFYGDPDLLAMFTFPLVKGDFRRTLSEPNSVVLTEDMAEKYFGRGDPLGKTITINNTTALIVTGVVQNPPANSHLRFDFLCPFLLAKETLKDTSYFESWNIHTFATYVKLVDGSSVESINQKIVHFLDNYDVEALKEDLYLQPLKRVHLYSESITPRYEGQGDIKYVYIFLGLAILVLIIACINFMNLSTARSANRAKEIGLRKVMGASETNIIFQFYGESLLLSFLSLFLAIAVVEVFLPFFRQVTGKDISLYSAGTIPVILGLVLIALLTGVLSGTYPALYLSGSQPGRVIKGIFYSGKGGAVFRRILVVSQFTFSIFLIISAEVVFFQIKYMENKDLGFNQSQLLFIPVRGDLVQRYEAVKSEFLRHPRIINTTITSTVPRQGLLLSGPTDKWTGKAPDKSLTWFLYAVSYDFLDTFKIPLIEGSFFSKTSPEEEDNGVVINETASRTIGAESPLGKRFTFWGNEFVIKGVVKDFNFRSMHHSIGPLILADAPLAFRFLFVRISSEGLPETLSYMEGLWKDFVPGYPFEYHFYDETLTRWYSSEQKIGSLINSFSLLAIFISCLGLFGLASFIAEQKTKEIGIRKVMGASVSGIILMLSKEFTRLIVIANLISGPIVYLVMQRWLQNFAYRIEFGFWIFLSAGILTLLIAWLTVSVQAIRAALVNPVDSLRYE